MNENGINTAEWLAAIDAHPETLETDLRVAAAMVLGDATSPEDVEDLDPERVSDSVEELAALGFLRSVLSTDHPEGEEHVLELTLPCA
ncbi:hypothetical protein [Prescottella equi]|uniref:hypothetical protein n=1 Tax=Rhodococcus hoagii TaxID=43767 RepID=UPI000A11E1B2|nr:hypothetical protein [Prescottella equi]ORL96632.1 hypothetical protein A5N69_15305 [Prescottella equi]ORM16017.1 hypothetical protein A5N74_19625 [Prescottella equi]